MVAATGAQIAIADGDLRTAREQALRSYRAAIGAEDRPLLAQASGATAELALALGQPERAAELLGAGAVVRGADDPTEPTALQLVPLLRARLGDERYEACYAAGRALSRPAAIERLDPEGLGEAGF
jgi:ATP/maltotriose-dependent transcriptional regulator MalT